LLNLTDNAIKFTDHGKWRSLSIQYRVSRGYLPLAFRVKDTGEGIAGDKFSVIFERFTQVSGDAARNMAEPGWD